MSEKEDVISIGKLIIYKNALIYENSVIQISNICSIWVADHSYTIHHRIPAWVKFLAFVGIMGVFLGLANKIMLVIILGLILTVAAIIGFIKHKPSTPISKYALGIERSSGRIMLFTAPDKAFVKKSAHAIMETISDNKKSSEMIVMNFEDKSVNIEKAVGSNIIGGDVIGSLVESFKNDED